MLKLLARLRGTDKRTLSQYWDAVVTRAPATPIPPTDVPVDLSTTIRQIHVMDEQAVQSAPFAERQQRMLLAMHQETNAMNQLPHALPVPTATSSSRNGNFGRTFGGRNRWAFALNAVTILVLIVVAALTANRLIDRSPQPTDQPVIIAASSPVADASPSLAADVPTLIWAASDHYGDREFPLYVPMAIAVGPDGNIYALDAGNNTIDRFDSSGRDLGSWVTPNAQGPGLGNQQFNLNDGSFYLGGISFDADGNVYVFDSLNNRILKFDREGTFLLEWGSSGTGNGQFSLPVGTVDTQNGLVYVADYGNHRVQVFDLEGNFLDKWGSEGRKGGQFYFPSAIAIAHDGSVYVGEDQGGRIQHFDRNGRYLSQIGESTLGHITGMAIDADGNLLASAGPEGAIWVFATNGTAVLQITEIAGLESLSFPTGIAVAENGSIYLAMIPTDPALAGTASGELIQFKLPADWSR